MNPCLLGCRRPNDAKIGNDPRFAALLISCFPDLESNNLKDLVLIPFLLASGTAAGTRKSAAFALRTGLRCLGQGQPY